MTTKAEKAFRSALADIAGDDTHASSTARAVLDRYPELPLAGWRIVGRRWWQKSYGNTYHSVTVFDSFGNRIIHVPYEYGYGDCYLQTALDVLRETGHLPKENPQYGTQYIREVLGASYDVKDVERKRDL